MINLITLFIIYLFLRMFWNIILTMLSSTIFHHYNKTLNFCNFSPFYPISHARSGTMWQCVLFFFWIQTVYCLYCICRYKKHSIIGGLNIRFSLCVRNVGPHSLVKIILTTALNNKVQQDGSWLLKSTYVSFYFLFLTTASFHVCLGRTIQFWI